MKLINWADFRFGFELSGLLGSLLLNYWILSIIFLVGLILNIALKIRIYKDSKVVDSVLNESEESRA